MKYKTLTNAYNNRDDLTSADELILN